MTGQLKACGLTKSYWKGRNEVPVLRGVDLEVERGEMVAVAGSSGSGKSTLLHILGLLDGPDSGEVILENARIDNQSETQRDRLRNRAFGFIFQFYHLLPELTALENVMMPQLIRHGILSYWPARRRLRREGRRAARAGRAGPSADPSADRALRRRDAARGDCPRAWPVTRRSCWPMSPPETSTPAMARRCSSCCAT